MEVFLGRVMRCVLIWTRVGQGYTALAVGAGGSCLDIFSLVYIISLFFLPLAGLVGWLVVFGLNDPLRQYFSLYRVVSQREGEREEKG